MIIVHADKYHRQAIPYHIINIHDIMRIVFHRKFEKTTELLHRNPDKRIFFLRLFSFVIPTGQFHGQINRIVGFISQPLCLIGLVNPARLFRKYWRIKDCCASFNCFSLTRRIFSFSSSFVNCPTTCPNSLLYRLFNLLMTLMV